VFYEYRHLFLKKVQLLYYHLDKGQSKGERGQRDKWTGKQKAMENGNVKRYKGQQEANKGEGTKSQRTKNFSHKARDQGKQMRESDHGNGKGEKVRGQETQRTRARWIETM
jgi:hypothetical protein